MLRVNAGIEAEMRRLQQETLTQEVEEARTRGAARTARVAAEAQEV